MATFCKIPWKVKESIGAVCCGHYAVFAPLLKCGPAFLALQKQDEKKGIPFHGKIVVKGVTYFYCRYGMVSDPDIYTKKPIKN